MLKILVTGSAGFFGEILLKRLLRDGFDCVGVDLHSHHLTDPRLQTFQCDIRDKSSLETIFQTHAFDAIFHCAAILAHGHTNKSFLWDSNVQGTQNLADLAAKYHVPKIIFTSSNCLWGKNFHRPVNEDDAPQPIEIYGRSKLAAEDILLKKDNPFHAIVFRCPTIIDSGRLGLLSILFEFIADDRKIWVVGKGDNRYQFIYAEDLVKACLNALDYNKTAVFHIGSDHVKSLHDVFDFVIQKAKTRARVGHLPKAITLFFMRLAYVMRISPLGPYHYKMIAESFVFDTSRIKRELNWQPTLTNEQILWLAYEYYIKNRGEIHQRKEASAHHQASKMGVIRLLKWIS